MTEKRNKINMEETKKKRKWDLGQNTVITKVLYKELS